MKKTNTSTSRVLLITASFVVILLLVLSISKIKHISETTQAINACNISIKDKDYRLSELQELLYIQPELESLNLVLNEQIPPFPDERQIMDELQKLSQKNGLGFLQYIAEDSRGSDTDVDTNTGSLNRIDLDLEFTGKYASIIKLLEELSIGKRLIRIDGIQIASLGNRDDNVRATISAVAFYQNR